MVNVIGKFVKRRKNCLLKNNSCLDLWAGGVVGLLRQQPNLPVHEDNNAQLAHATLVGAIEDACSKSSINAVFFLFKKSFFLLPYWVLNSESHTCESGALAPEPLHQHGAFLCILLGDIHPSPSFNPSSVPGTWEEAHHGMSLLSVVQSVRIHPKGRALIVSLGRSWGHTTDASLVSFREPSKCQDLLNIGQTTRNRLLSPGGLYMLAVDICC
jgi:hypothetical protein